MLSLTIAAMAMLVTTDCIADESYPVHPDSIQKSGSPRGQVKSFKFNDSIVFPGTHRDVFVYVPAQYKPGSPAAVMVFQDGQKYVLPNRGWNLPTVFDNLISSGEMPVTIAVCVNPGVVPAANRSDAMDRFNRSYEYDSVSDRYATFIVDEILPEVSKKYTITNDPNLRGIGGSSSGAIAAFGVAWHRPDQFRRVFSTVGTFVGLRGGNEYPTLVRKTEPKPLRVFLQDGKNDLNIYGGSWWNANQTMLSSLQWAGYAVEHRWGDGGHNGKHGAAIFPDAMRWLWKDHETPIRTDYSSHPELKSRLVADSDWKPVSTGHGEIPRLITDLDGSVYFIDEDSSKAFSIKPGQTAPESIALSDVPNVFAKFAAASVGDSVADQSGSTPKPIATTLTPDKEFLIVVDANERFVWSYQVASDGKLRFGQPFGYLHSPLGEMSTSATDVVMTKDGSPIVATKLGLQIFDQPGRVHAILPAPDPSQQITAVALGGTEMSTLFIVAGDSVYSRETKIVGVLDQSEPIKPAKPRL